MLLNFIFDFPFLILFSTIGIIIRSYPDLILHGPAPIKCNFYLFSFKEKQSYDEHSKICLCKNWKGWEFSKSYYDSFYFFPNIFLSLMLFLKLKLTLFRQMECMWGPLTLFFRWKCFIMVFYLLGDIFPKLFIFYFIYYNFLVIKFNYLKKKWHKNCYPKFLVLLRILVNNMDGRNYFINY